MRKIGEIWKDEWISKEPWRLRLEKNIVPFKRKKDAVVFYEKWIAAQK